MLRFKHPLGFVEKLSCIAKAAFGDDFQCPLTANMAIFCAKYAKRVHALAAIDSMLSCHVESRYNIHNRQFPRTEIAAKTASLNMSFLRPRTVMSIPRTSSCALYPFN